MPSPLRTATALVLAAALGGCSEPGTGIPSLPDGKPSSPPTTATPTPAPSPSPSPGPAAPTSMIVGYRLRWEGQTNIDGAVLRIRGGPVDSVTSSRVRTSLVRVSSTESVLTFVGRIQEDDDDDGDDLVADVIAANVWVPPRSPSSGDVHTVTLERVSGRGNNGSDPSRYRVTLSRIIR